MSDHERATCLRVLAENKSALIARYIREGRDPDKVESNYLKAIEDKLSELLAA